MPNWCVHDRDPRRVFRRPHRHYRHRPRVPSFAIWILALCLAWKLYQLAYTYTRSLPSHVTQKISIKQKRTFAFVGEYTTLRNIVNARDAKILPDVMGWIEYEKPGLCPLPACGRRESSTLVRYADRDDRLPQTDRTIYSHGTDDYVRLCLSYTCLGYVSRVYSLCVSSSVPFYILTKNLSDPAPRETRKHGRVAQRQQQHFRAVTHRTRCTIQELFWHGPIENEINRDDVVTLLSSFCCKKGTLCDLNCRCVDCWCPFIVF